MLIGIIAGGVILAVCILALYIRNGLRRKARTKRTGLLEDFALRQGFSFTGEADPSFIESRGLQTFHLFSRRNGKTVWFRNLAEGRLAGRRAAIFDYSIVATRYKTTRAPGTSVAMPGAVEQRYTAAVLELDRAAMPAFLLRVRMMGSKIEAVEGWSEVEFEEDRAFLKKFRLASRDPEAVRKFFTPASGRIS